jgi:hypothetical protein
MVAVTEGGLHCVAGTDGDQCRLLCFDQNITTPHAVQGTMMDVGPVSKKTCYQIMIRLSINRKRTSQVSKNDRINCHWQLWLIMTVHVVTRMATQTTNAAYLQ